MLSFKRPGEAFGTDFVTLGCNLASNPITLAVICMLPQDLFLDTYPFEGTLVTFEINSIQEDQIGCNLLYVYLDSMEHGFGRLKCRRGASEI